MSQKSIDKGLAAVARVKTKLKEMKEGKFSEGIWPEKTTLQEMITTSDVPAAFVEKTTLEIYNGRENVPLIYTDLYDIQTNRSFPKKLTVKPMAWASCVFLEKLEGGESVFGAMNPAAEVTVPIKTYAAGFEVTEDMIEYNELYSIDENAHAMGEAFNKFLNDLHLSPIITGVYTASAGTPQARKKTMIGVPGTLGVAQFVDFTTDLKTTLIQALKILGGGSDFKILVNSADRIYLEDALEGMILGNTTIPTVVKKLITLEKFIVYDGDDIYVQEEVVSYVGVPDDYIFIVYPKRQLRSYVKHDLIVDTGNEDLSRLIEKQQIGRARLGILAQLGGRYGVMKVKIR